MKPSDKQHAKRHTGEPATPRPPQREDQPLKQINEDPDAKDGDSQPPSGKVKGRAPVPRDDLGKPTVKDS